MSKIETFTSKFEVKKFNGKKKLSKEGEEGVSAIVFTRSCRESAKLASMLDENCEEMNLQAVSTIQLYLANEVIYNVMDEEMATGL